MYVNDLLNKMYLINEAHQSQIIIVPSLERKHKQLWLECDPFLISLL